MMDKLAKRLPEFKLAAKLSRLAYLHSRDARELEELQARAVQKSVLHIFESRESGTQGVVFIDHSAKAIYIAYCGTQNLQDWGTNLRVCKKPMGKIHIHRGVRYAIRTVRDRVMLAVHSYLDYRIYLTGHSLGGMCAQAACAWLEDRFKRTKDITLITFGAGMIASTNDINDAIHSPHYRFQNGSDAVPRRPALPIFYGHPTCPNHCHIYFPNSVKELGLYLFDPDTLTIWRDRLFTLGERVTDHDIRDYEAKLDEVIV
ncbi:MAG: lipase family protein [Gammaproteobacteria bacterium]|nr:lipase family protein [Gammaproteobacteria bacterium]